MLKQEVYIVACRAVAMQRPMRGTDIPGPFLGNGSVNIFPQQQTRRQQLKSCVFTWSMPRCYKQWTWLELSQFCTGVCKERT
jgi:hypothetical protein